ncbi:MAG: outer membrane homotrimeric porin [Desulfovibrionales bacterium]|nr:outer membrane homotrimeric porin [Desulfovibrionales bacterium]
MKRIIVLALAACMVLGAALGASAAEFKASGNFVLNYDSLSYDKAEKDYNKFSQRFRSQIDMIASENLSGTVYFEIGSLTWGKDGAALGTDGTNVKTRYAYVDFMVPATPVKVRAGLQAIALPSATAGSPVLDKDVAAITGTASFDAADVTAFFARPYDTAEKSFDLYGATASVKVGPATVTPYLMYGSEKGNAVAATSTAAAIPAVDAKIYWAGVAADAAFGNLTVGVDAIYGEKEDDAAADVDGYFVAADAAYALDFATVGVLAWTSSDGKDLMPTVKAENNFSPLMLVGDTTKGATDGAGLYDTIGSQGVAVRAADISFIEKLSHTVTVGYVELDNAFKGDIIEVDFSNSYLMYDNLELFVEAAYADVDADAAGNDDEIVKVAAGLTYNF